MTQDREFLVNEFQEFLMNNGLYTSFQSKAKELFGQHNRLSVTLNGLEPSQFMSYMLRKEDTNQELTRWIDAEASWRRQLDNTTTSIMRNNAKSMYSEFGIDIEDIIKLI